jgi:hypothetical protein
MHLLPMSLALAFHVVIIPNLHDETKALSVSIFSSRGGSSLFLALYGSAGASPVDVLLNSFEDMLNLRGGGEKYDRWCIDLVGSISEWFSP